MAAASNDRTLTIWDARSFKAPLQEIEHGYAVTSAYWSPLGNKLATTSYDDHVRVFDLDSSDNLSLLSAIPHNNHTGKYVSENKQEFLVSFDSLFIDGLPCFEHDGIRIQLLQGISILLLAI